MRWGRFDLTLLHDRPFRLDGGAMFGVVPRPLWARAKPPDDRNRIGMITNCLLLRSDAEVVLVDTGLGGKLGEKAREIFAVDETDASLIEALETAGVTPAGVTHVLLSHLHFDHCGWNTRNEGGDWVPTFPNAAYWIARGELAHARDPNERDQPSYDPRNFEPLWDAGLVRLMDDEDEPVPGVRMVRVPGHTEDMCIFLVDGGADGTLAFWSDLCPTAAHVPTTWVMGYDSFPVTTMANKQQWLPRAAEKGWICVFQHDPELPLGRIVSDRPGRYRAEPVTSD